MRATRRLLAILLFLSGAAFGQSGTLGSAGCPLSGCVTGTVTSVGNGTIGPLFSVSWATATTTPALSLNLVASAANCLVAGPTSGGSAVPTCRALVAADVPASIGLGVMTTLGDTVYGGASGAATRLAGNTTATKKFLMQVGDGAASAAPSWTATAADFPTLNQSTTGNAATATGPAATPSDCSAGDFVKGLNADFSLDCATPAGGSAPFSDATAIVKNAADATKLFKVDASGVTASNTITLTATGTAALGNVTTTGAWIGRGDASPFVSSGTASTDVGLAERSSGVAQIVLGDGSAHAPTWMSTVHQGVGSVAAITFGAAGTSLWNDGSALWYPADSTNSTFHDWAAASLQVRATNGGRGSETYSGELLTLSTSGTTTATAGNLATASSEIHAITARVTTTITTATDWSVAVTSGLAGCTTAWVAIGTTTAPQTGLTAGTTVTFVPASGLRCTVSTATTLTVTTTGTPGAGAVRLIPFVRTYTAPTS